MAGSAEKKVQDAIKSSKIVIFSKTRCPYCVRVKEVFQKKGKEYSAIELDKMSDCSDLQDVLQGMTGARTVPRVFIKGKSYGGCDDVMKLEQSGQLDKILAQSSDTEED